MMCARLSMFDSSALVYKWKRSTEKPEIFAVIIYCALCSRVKFANLMYAVY